jgi:cytochrome c oxidase subunit 3
MSTLVANYFNTNNRIHPLKFGLWLGMASIVMMFVAFTSAYLVRQAAGNWLEFALPRIFFVSTIVILISSVTLHLSYRSFVQENISVYRSLLVLSFLLGIAFIVLQYQGWMQLYSLGIDLKGNPSGGFLYVISGIHAVHVLGGLVAMFIALLSSFLLKKKISERRKINFELTLQYWHFVDLLWVYLLLFLYISR